MYIIILLVGLLLGWNIYNSACGDDVTVLAIECCMSLRNLQHTITMARDDLGDHQTTRNHL